MGGISMPTSNAGSIGFDLDRRWMLIDDLGSFVSQRTHPQLALFIPSLVDDHIVINYCDEEIRFRFNEILLVEINTKVWDDAAVTVEVSKKVNTWLSDRLKKEVRLVKLASDTSRSHRNSRTMDTYDVTLADAYPYLIIGTASLAELNGKLVNPIPMDRFRPSVVIATEIPHEEDKWSEIRIGKAIFKNIKPCGRCTVITIDQQTGIVDNEPLRILSTYRKSDNSVLFGCYYVCTQIGEISIGETVEID